MIGSPAGRRLVWYSIVRRIGACSATKTVRPVDPARNQKRQPVGSLGLKLNLIGGELGQEVRKRDLTVDDLADQAHQIAFDAQECARLHGK